MTADDAATRGREAAEALMEDLCAIRRRGEDVLDPDTNLYLPNWDDIYTGACRVRFASASTQSHELAGQLLVAQQSVLSLPYDLSADVQVDDEAEITTQGITFRIAGLFAQTYATARRFPVEVLS